jgi:Mrp family chromosome partitioning ATPase
MPNVSNEGTPRERLARLLALLGRTRRYWRSSSAIALVGVGLSVLVALKTKGVWRSEATILYRDAVETRDGEPASRRAARLGPKLKELVNARARLAALVAEYDLYPQKAGTSQVDAVLEMQKNIGFRASNSDTFVVSFANDDPVVAQRVTARLAELVIQDYERESLDTASLTRDLLRKELTEADHKVEEASRALATFLAQHPQFTWGTESPYATMPVPGLPLLAVPASPLAAGAAARSPSPSADPEAAAIEARLARIEVELAPPAPPGAASSAPPTTVAEAEKQKAAAAAAVGAAQAALAEKLLTVTPAHPDAVAARAHLAAAQAAAAAADAALAKAKAGLPASSGPTEPATPERRAELQRERAMLRQRLFERRTRPAGAEPTAATDPGPSGASSAGAGKPQSTVELETEWHRLRLELDQARERFRAAQVDARNLGASSDDVRKKSQAEMLLLDPAYLPPRPEKGRGRVLFAGATIALFLALAYAASRVLLDDTLYDEGDVVAAGGPEVLVALPPIDVVEPPLRAIVPAAWWAEPLDAPAGGADWTVVERDDDEEEGFEPEDDGVVRAIPVGPSTPPPPAAPREGVSTLRFGSFVDGALDAARAAALGDGPARTLLAPRTLRAAAHGPGEARGALALAGSAADEPFAAPEVEIVGADVDADGEGVAGLLRQAPSDVLATLRVLRHRLDQRRGEGHLVITVTSPGAGEGKTVLAARLALALAEADRARVLLVEGNLGTPRLASALGLRIPEAAGLSEQVRRRLCGRRAPWGVVRLTASLAVLAEPGREAAFPGALHSPALAAALRALRQSHDYVIIDGPPVLGAGDANVLEDLSDGVIVVVRAGRTHGAELARATHQLGDRRILGVVLNEVP